MRSVSRQVSVEWGESAEELHGKYRAESDLGRRKRLLALWLVRRGEGVGAASEEAGVGKRTLERWLRWYREGGLETVLDRVPGHGGRGAESRLSAEQIEELFVRSERGQFGTYGEARRWVQQQWGVVYAYGGMYSLLSGVTIRPKVPRPVAEKADEAAREAWKKGGS